MFARASQLLRTATTRLTRVCAVSGAALLLGASAALAQSGFHGDLPEANPSSTPSILQQVGIDEHRDAQIPTDLAFRDETGKTVHLGEYFTSGRPLILNLVYFSCPMLCTQTLNDLTQGMNGLSSLDAGKDFDVLTISFDPKETPELAAAKKKTYLRGYRRPTAEAGWHFLTGDKDSIDTLTKTVGFRYAWDDANKQFVHASGLVILTPAGKISQYLMGIGYAPVDLHAALDGAATGKVAALPLNDHAVLYCFSYDPATGRYGLIVARAVKVMAAMTLLALAGFVGFQLYRDRTGRNGPNGRFPVVAPPHGS